MSKIVAFHIDMNVAQFSRAYIKRWLDYLADAGYNAILWEVENNIRWETCAECASPDAFSKDAFREILAHARSLGLEPVPLLQTIGHAEYVLKHNPYAHLRESPDRIDQYCPLHPEVVPFLTRWIDEYFDVFGEVRLFHLGADEARILGACSRCAEFVKQHSLSELYINHINAVAEPVCRRGATPIIWCDMALNHPQALAALSRDIWICDWTYNTHLQDSKVQVWGQGLVEAADLDDQTLDNFGEFIYPDGPDSPPNIFYTTDYLKAQGFHVITCPGASSAGDNVFSPLESKHQANTWDFGGKGLADAEGAILTSWSVHLHPWELQKACIDMLPYRATHPGASIQDFRLRFARDTFGLITTAFFEACSQLEGHCPYSYTKSLGYDKSCGTVPIDHIRRDLATTAADGKLEQELEEARVALAHYCNARSVLRNLANRAKTGERYLEAWFLAADVLVHRARSALFLLSREKGTQAGDPTALSAELDALEQRMRRLYTRIHRPTRREEMLRWMFASLREAILS